MATKRIIHCAALALVLALAASPEPAWSVRTEDRRAELEDRCRLPRVPPRTRVILFSSYGGDSLASVAVGGSDRRTEVIDVLIEPGSEPLYVLLSSYESMVWRLRGATRRVTRLVVSSHVWSGAMSAAGVIGVPPSRVTITRAFCPRYASPRDPGDQAFARAQIERAVGRLPNSQFFVESAQQASLPSGAITRGAASDASRPRRFDPALWRQATVSWPGGLVRLRAAEVLAAVPVRRYQVLPGPMGFAQLIGSGAAVRIGDDAFKLVRRIPHLPPGMSGAHSAVILLPAGMKVPPGDPGHACIVREGEVKIPSGGSTCDMLPTEFRPH